jgi:hypothetical protein
MTPPQAAAASSIQLALTASQRPRVMLCVQAKWVVPISSWMICVRGPQALG